MNRPKTRLATLYRFVPGVRGSHEEMFDAYTQYVSEQSLDERHADTEFFEVAGVPAIWIGIQEDEKEAEWTEEFATTTGLDLAYSERRCGGALLLGIDGTAYALSYGNGYRLIPDELKDQRFGLSFLIRRLDGDQVRDLVRRRANARGRIDSTVVAAGAPVWMLGVAENVEIIRRIGGRAKDLKVTFSSARRPRGQRGRVCRPADAVRGRAGRARRGYPRVRAGLPGGRAGPGARVHRVRPAGDRRRHEGGTRR